MRRPTGPRHRDLQKARVAPISLWEVTAAYFHGRWAARQREITTSSEPLASALSQLRTASSELSCVRRFRNSSPQIAQPFPAEDLPASMIVSDLRHLEEMNTLFVGEHLKDKLKTAAEAVGVPLYGVH